MSLTHVICSNDCKIGRQNPPPHRPWTHLEGEGGKQGRVIMSLQDLNVLKCLSEQLGKGSGGPLWGGNGSQGKVRQLESNCRYLQATEGASAILERPSPLLELAQSTAGVSVGGHEGAPSST